MITRPRLRVAALGLIVLAAAACREDWKYTVVTTGPDLLMLVTTTADSPDTDPGDGRCADAFDRCTLRAAIDEANWSGGARVLIHLTSGRYAIGRPGADEDGNFSGDLDVDAMLHIEGVEKDVVLAGEGIDRVLHVLGGRVVLSNLTVTGGAADRGGGIRVSVGRLELDGVTVEDNIADADLGRFARGGGIHLDRATEALILRSVIRSNTAIGRGSLDGRGDGGGIYAAGTLEIAQSVVRENQAIEPGTAIVSGSNPGDIFVVTMGGAGGGIDVDGGSLSVLDSAIEANQAAMMGGGIRYRSNGWPGSEVLLAGTLVAANVSTHSGSGIHVETLDEPVAITRSTIAANSSSGGSAGLWVEATVIDSLATIRVDASTFADNTPVGIRATPLTAGVRLAGSAVDDGCIDDSSWQPASGGYNVFAHDLVGARDDCGIPNATDRYATDPLLGPLADNGGPTRTLLPDASSPLVDAIPPGTIELCDGAISVDQRGVPRPRGEGCDIGAVERAQQ